MTDPSAQSSVEFIEVTTTLPSETLAAEVATALVSRKLAGCVQITGPITSLYRWQGTISNDTEFRLSIKSSRKLQSKLIEAIQSIHPYAVPEILVASIEIATHSYASWLLEQLDENT